VKGKVKNELIAILTTVAKKAMVPVVGALARRRRKSGKLTLIFRNCKIERGTR
jgi:primosomal replication protein N